MCLYVNIRAPKPAFGVVWISLLFVTRLKNLLRRTSEDWCVFNIARSGMVDLGRSDCIMVTTFEAESSEDIVTQVMPAKLIEVGTAAFKDR